MNLNSILWLLGEWLPVLPREAFSSLFMNVGRALAEPDMVVRLTAATTISGLFHDHFNEVRGDFLKNMEPIMTNLFRLVADSKEFDTRQRVMSVIQLIVGTCGADVRRPHYLPCCCLFVVLT
jgi:hypothetical protein